MKLTRGTQIKRLVSFTPRSAEMIEELMDHSGFSSFSVVVQTAIAQLHEKTFKYNIASNSTKDPNQKAIQKVKYEEAKKKQEDISREELKIDICNELKGKVISEGGKNYCAYDVYNYTDKHQAKIPFTQLSKDLLKTQYTPSKEVVQKLLKK